MRINSLDYTIDGEVAVYCQLHLTDLVFDPDVQIQVLPEQGYNEHYSTHIKHSVLAPQWLPSGDYRLRLRLNDLRLPAGHYRLRVIVFEQHRSNQQKLFEASIPLLVEQSLQAADLSLPDWQLGSVNGTVPINDLSWAKGDSNWFYRHFDHAANVVIHYMLKDHPALCGKVLDVGCGDGITDVGVFLRKQPELLVGIDPFKGYQRLPEVLRGNHIPLAVLDDPRLQFKPADANAIPYPDDHFDVVLSWGSLEHIAGGYQQALEEIKRVLKPGGLVFAHPGLYYGEYGNHLGEFFRDPYIHLKLPPEELQQRVLNSEPQRMDRAGHQASPAEYWQWFTELNPITVPGFEQEMRALGFEPWRVALRISDSVEYTAELQNYSFVDLAVRELYASFRLVG